MKLGCAPAGVIEVGREVRSVSIESEIVREPGVKGSSAPVLFASRDTWPLWCLRQPRFCQRSFYDITILSSSVWSL